MLRVVVYAEGAAESAGQVTSLPAPGEPLAEEQLGVAHRLIRRCAQETRPSLAIDFVAPLRAPDGTTLRGSRLRVRKHLRRALTWAAPPRRPALAVVLVDEDGEGQIATRLGGDLAGIDLPHVLAVPVREFEAWLIADVAAARRIFELELDEPPDPESMAPQQAKRLLDSWCAKTARRAPDGAIPAPDRRDLRAELVTTCSLDRLRRLRSFETFARDLRLRVEALGS